MRKLLLVLLLVAPMSSFAQKTVATTTDSTGHKWIPTGSAMTLGVCPSGESKIWNGSTYICCVQGN